jgi:pimeloyl-ACP methyl ester carboxylesterase
VHQQTLLKTIILVISFLSANRLGAQTFTTRSSDSVPITYELHGKGTPALVFVHGWSCDRSYWKGQIEPFSHSYTLVAIDLAGHGESGTDRKSYTIESFGADVAAVVNNLHLQRVILIGHSMGGDVIAAAARLLPREQIVGLVMVDTYKKLGPGRTPEQVEAFVSRFRSDFKDSVYSLARSMFSTYADTALVEWVANDMSSAPAPIALSALESAFSYSREITKALSEVMLPVTAINSDNSPTDMASMQRYGVKVIIIPRVGHFIMLEDTKRFNEVLASVIKQMMK